MDFKQATDILSRTITQAHIARAADVSHHSIRQARLAHDHPGHRTPPRNWPTAVARLARQRSDELLRLALALEQEAGVPDAWDRAVAASPAVRATPSFRPTEATPPPAPPPAEQPTQPTASPSLTQRLLRRLMK